MSFASWLYFDCGVDRGQSESSLTTDGHKAAAETTQPDCWWQRRPQITSRLNARQLRRKPQHNHTMARIMAFQGRRFAFVGQKPSICKKPGFFSGWKECDFSLLDAQMLFLSAAVKGPEDCETRLIPGCCSFSRFLNGTGFFLQTDISWLDLKFLVWVCPDGSFTAQIKKHKCQKCQNECRNHWSTETSVLCYMLLPSVLVFIYYVYVL